MDQEHTLTFGPFRLETTSGRLWCEDDVIPLRPRSMAMLQYLVERPGRLVTKAELLQQVWAGGLMSATTCCGLRCVIFAKHWVTQPRRRSILRRSVARAIAFSRAATPCFSRRRGLW